MVPLSRREAMRTKRTLEKALKAGHRPPSESSGKGPTAINAAAQALELPRTTVAARIKIMKRVHGLEPDWKLWQPPKGAGKIAQANDLAEQKRRDELAAVKRENVALKRQINDSEDFRQALFGLAGQPVNPPRWTLSSRNSNGPGVPVLFTSDFQWGETVNRPEVDGLNEYSIAIAQRRYKRLIETAIHLSFDHTVKPKYPGIVYLRGGDAINGEIHEEFLVNNELTSIPALTDLCETECAGIEALLSKFDRVQVYSVPGNHGRTTRKPWSAGYAAMNYETLLAHMIEREFKNERRVRFVTPKSGDVYFTVRGTRSLLTHGDRIGSRGGQGFVGPVATIQRGHYKVRDQYAQSGLPVDCVLTGHFHTYFVWDHGIANGSLVGPNSFSKNVLRARPEPASQTFFHVHERFGITDLWRIWVDAPPKAGDVPWVHDRFMDSASAAADRGGKSA